VSRLPQAASRPPLVARGLLGLLLVASLAPNIALAHGHASSAGAPTAAPGGTTMAAATRLHTGLGYRGTIAEPGQQAWYKLESDGYPRAQFDIAGKTISCPARATMLDTHGRTLGQLISTTSETLPLLARFPTHPISNVYYLRIDADPYSACANAAYVFHLAEPLQPEPCSLPEADGREIVCGYGPAPPLLTRACASAAKQVQQLSREVALEAALVSRRRGSVATLRRLESEEHTASRKSSVSCD
jgi:hypothetical protein